MNKDKLTAIVEMLNRRQMNIYIVACVERETGPTDECYIANTANPLLILSRKAALIALEYISRIPPETIVAELQGVCDPKGNFTDNHLTADLKLIWETLGETLGETQPTCSTCVSVASCLYVGDGSDVGKGKHAANCEVYEAKS